MDILLSQDGSVTVVVSTAESPAGIDISQERGLSRHDQVGTRRNGHCTDCARLLDWKHLRIVALAQCLVFDSIRQHATCRRT